MVSLFRKSKTSEGADLSDANSDLSQLLKDRVGLSPKDLAAGVQRARHVLPRRTRKQLATLIDAEEMMNHPRLRMLVDTAEIDKTRDEVTAYLKSIDPRARKSERALRFLAGLAFNFLLAGALLIALLRWRGFI